MTLTATQIADAVHGKIVAGDAAALVTSGVSTDTRKLPEGCLFIALKGEKFDANTFAPQALANGASVVIVSNYITGRDGFPSRPPENNGQLGELSQPNKAVILVPDTLLALQALASWWRNSLTRNVVGLTGSNGKTSTKDFTASVLREKFSVNATKGNLNNHIGLPLTVLETTPEHTAAVFEMGMNHPGEIAPLTAIARPHIAIITNIGSAHIEYMGTREAIAKEKASIAAHMTADDFVIIHHDCEFQEIITASTQAKIVIVGAEKNFIHAENATEKNGCASFTLCIGEEKANVTLPVAGKHMIANALLAAAAGNLLDISIEKIAHGLSHTSLTSGRLRRFEHEGILVFDDTYNANPESMIAGLETLANTECTGKKIAVLGRMGELGTHLAEGAKRVGECAASLQLTTITVGNDADLISKFAGTSAIHFSNKDDAAAWLQTNTKQGDVILFKGSRGSTMETLMNQVFPSNTLTHTH